MDMQVQDLTPETNKEQDPIAQMFAGLIDHVATAVLAQLLDNPKHWSKLQDITRAVIETEAQEAINQKFEEFDLSDKWDDISSMVDDAVSDWVGNNFDITDYEDDIKRMVDLDEEAIAEALRGSDFTVTFS